jgi:hypothetical protein
VSQPTGEPISGSKVGRQTWPDRAAVLASDSPRVVLRKLWMPNWPTPINMLV